MPKPDQIADTTTELIAMLGSDPSFRDAVYSFKVQALISKDEQMGENPTPDIVVYPRHNVRSVVQTLRGLRKHFNGREGRGITPRFNVEVGEGGLLYMAEGHGHEKKYRYESNVAQLAAAYDPDQNYAFSEHDAPLVKRIRELAETMD